MNILVAGGGGREHAIIKKLKESPKADTVFCMPGNGGIGQDLSNGKPTVCLEGSVMDAGRIISHIREHGIGFTVVSPDDPLVAGVADKVRDAGFAAFGPTAEAARVEGSKVFSKALMKKYRIPTAGYETFDDPKACMAYIKEENRYPTVIKADGLALGKGVIIAETEAEAEAAVTEIMVDRKFGDSGSRVVVEEFLSGPEVTVLAFTDGTTCAPLPASMDHKRAFDGDKGPNTGGMGVVAPNPFYTPAIAAWCRQHIFAPTVAALAAEGCPFRGCLYFGLMLTPKGPRVIEYNCRFGDPEAQAVLPLLQTDLLDVMQATAAGRLADVAGPDGQALSIKPAATCCVTLASKGYPGPYDKGAAIEGLDAAASADVIICHAGTTFKDGVYRTAGGRVLNVTAVGKDLPDAVRRAYEAAAKIRCDNLYYRRDIGAKALAAL